MVSETHAASDPVYKWADTRDTNSQDVGACSTRVVRA